MKRLLGALMGLSLLIGSATVAFGQEKQKKEDEKKEEKKDEKKDEKKKEEKKP